MIVTTANSVIDSQNGESHDASKNIFTEAGNDGSSRAGDDERRGDDTRRGNNDPRQKHQGKQQSDSISHHSFRSQLRNPDG